MVDDLENALELAVGFGLGRSNDLNVHAFIGREVLVLSGVDAKSGCCCAHEGAVSQTCRVGFADDLLDAVLCFKEGCRLAVGEHTSMVIRHNVGAVPAVRADLCYKVICFPAPDFDVA